MNPTTIVCPIVSPPADRIPLAEAIRLARWYEAELHVVHVGQRVSADTVRDPMSIPGMLDGLGAVPAGVTTVVLPGDPVAEIARYVRRAGADLLVLRQPGARTLPWRTHAIASAVARAVDCPTLAVPDRSRPTEDGTLGAPFASILCATDFSEASSQAVRHALTLAQESAARLTLLHVLERFPYENVYSASWALQLLDESKVEAERTSRRLQRLVPPEAANWCEVECLALMGDADEVIASTARSRSAELVVMGAPTRSRLEQFVMGSTVRGVLRRSLCPVMLVPVPASVPVLLGKPLAVRPAGPEAPAVAAWSR